MILSATTVSALMLSQDFMFSLWLHFVIINNVDRNITSNIIASAIRHPLIPLNFAIMLITYYRLILFLTVDMAFPPIIVFSVFLICCLRIFCLSVMVFSIMESA